MTFLFSVSSWRLFYVSIYYTIIFLVISKWCKYNHNQWICFWLCNANVVWYFPQKSLRGLCLLDAGAAACAQAATDGPQHATCAVTRCYKPDELPDSTMPPIKVVFFLIINVYLQLEVCISKSEMWFETNTHFRCLGVPCITPHPRIGFTHNLSCLLATRYEERLHLLWPACIVSCSNDSLP